VNKRTLLKWILLAAMAFAVLAAPIPFSSPSPQEHIVRIEAKSYEFHPGIIRVNPGDLVNIELVSTDVVHGIYIDGLGWSSRLTLERRLPLPFKPIARGHIVSAVRSPAVRCILS
jgi:heme/copper-type cytochrome/quinol oxidase subunit 2